MKISEKQIFKLIEMAEQYSLTQLDKNMEFSLYIQNFLSEIRNQQSDELMEIK